MVHRSQELGQQRALFFSFFYEVAFHEGRFKALSTQIQLPQTYLPLENESSVLSGGPFEEDLSFKNVFATVVLWLSTGLLVLHEEF